MKTQCSIEAKRICAVDDVPLGEGREARVADRPLAVFHTEAGWYAIDNTCTHQGGPLADGLVGHNSVACPLHDRRFDLNTGRAIGHECGAVATYPVEVRDGAVFVGIPNTE